jgi:hypothetical protein
VEIKEDAAYTKEIIIHTTFKQGKLNGIDHFEDSERNNLHNCSV